MKRSQTPHAFSLVELLAVAAILTALASMLVPVAGAIRQRGEATRCLANLRQIGVALTAYCTEHSQFLPGPLLPSQGPRYNRVNGAYTTYLASYLYPYLALPEPPAGPLPTLDEAIARAPVFYCITFGKVAHNRFPNPYFMRWQVPGMGGKPPWGNADATTIPQTPRRITEVPSPAHTWAMSDLDQQSPNLPAASWVHNLPEKPIHQGARNALYFDGRVGRIDRDGNSL